MSIDSDTAPTNEQPTQKGIQQKVSENILNTIDLVIADRKKYYHEHPDKTPHPQAIDEMIKRYAATNFAVSGALNLIPGPWGLITIIPDLMVVFRNQLALVYDIGVAYGQQKILNRGILAWLLLSATGSSAGSLIVMQGTKALVRRSSLRVFQRLVNALAGRITQQVLKSTISKWLPVVGAAAMASWSSYITYRIGSKAKELFSKEIILLEEELTDEESTGEEILADAEKEGRAGDEAVDPLKLQRLSLFINLIRVDRHVDESERIFLDTMLESAELSEVQRSELRAKLDTDSLLPIDYDVLRAKPEDVLTTLIDLVALANRDGTLHITEQMYIKSVGEKLGFSHNDMQNLLQG